MKQIALLLSASSVANGFQIKDFPGATTALMSTPSYDIFPQASDNHLNRRQALASCGIVASVATTGIQAAQAAYIDPTSLPISHRVYVDVSIGGEKERIVMSLFGKAMPRTVENFVNLARDNGYAGTTFYRVLSDYTIQGGAIGGDSKTGKSSFGDGQPFEPDNYDIKHSVAGLVSMVRGVGGGADSRFFISCKDDAGWADDRYAAFGIVQDQDSLEVVRKIEKVKVKPPSNVPKEPVEIVGSGVL